MADLMDRAIESFLKANQIAAATVVDDLKETIGEKDAQVERLLAGILTLRNSIHACNRNPIPNSKRREWRALCDALLKTSEKRT